MGLCAKITCSKSKKPIRASNKENTKCEKKSSVATSNIWKGRRSERHNIRRCVQGFSALNSNPNAGVSNTMAPALTEPQPLSPTEELTSSPTSATPNTRSSKKHDSIASTSQSIANGFVNKERKSRLAASVSTVPRRTRSRGGINQSPLEQTVGHTSSSSSSVPKKSPKLNNEQMGLSATTVNNNNETTPVAEVGKDNSTAQLLADLTNDFEETITAEICLRKQLLDSNLGKSAVHSPASTPKSVLEEVGAALGGVKYPRSEKHMESEIIEETETHNIVSNEPAECSRKQEEEEQKLLNQDETAAEVEVSTARCADNEEEKEDLPTLPPKSPKLETEQEQSKIPPTDELRSIRTDSTMTASEVEDNLEERLSQLDGNAASAMVTDDELTTAATNITHRSQSKTLTQQGQNVSSVPITQQILPISQGPATSINIMSSTSGVSQSFVKESGSGELEDQDIEEVLKVLKGLDTTSNADGLCDLNVLFNEVYTTLNYDDVNTQTGQTLAKPLPHKELQVDIEKKQQTLQRRTESLLRRMHKVQARHMCKHTSEEIAGVFEWSVRMANKGVRNAHDTEDETDQSVKPPVITSRPDAVNWAQERSNYVPAMQMSSLLRRVETAANEQQLCTSPPSGVNNHLLMKRAKKTTENVVVPTTTSTEGTGERVVPTFDTNFVEEIAQVSGLLHSELSMIQKAIDPDATESSSGAESTDEMITYNNQIQQRLPIVERAAWRYARQRAAIGARWYWLHSQIADLEIKIRQQYEALQDIARTKSTVVSEGEIEPKQKEAASSSINGYKGEVDAKDTISTDNTVNGDEEDVLSGSCRTRGYVPSLFQKRKLLQTTNIHTISKKAARPTTIKCGCQWPLYPCTVCTGRVDPTAPRDLPDTMMMGERVALLDPGYHPALSFAKDIDASIHFEAYARMPDWQQRILRTQPKGIAKSIWKAEREAANMAGHLLSRKFGEHAIKRRYVKRKNRINASEEGGGTPANKGTGGNAMEPSSEAGNGTGTLSTSTTPLVANNPTKIPKKLHCHLVGDGVLMEPQTSSTITSNNQSMHQTSDYHPKKYDQFSPNQVHSSLISNSNTSSNNNKNNRYRKYTSTTTNAYQHNNNNQSYYNNSQYYNSNGNNDLNFLYSNESWENFATRSRPVSPTQGNYHHKYERYPDRKHRNSYDIDNIVIPYSVAAATRVEILPYKEIPTPKWRIIDDKNCQNDELSLSNLNEATETEPESSNDALKNVSSSSIEEKAPTVVEDINSNNTDSTNLKVKDGLSDKNFENTPKTVEINPQSSDKNKIVSQARKNNITLKKANSKLNNDMNPPELTENMEFSEPVTKKQKIEKNINDESKCNDPEERHVDNSDNKETALNVGKNIKNVSKNANKSEDANIDGNIMRQNIKGSNNENLLNHNNSDDANSIDLKQDIMSGIESSPETGLASDMDWSATTEEDENEDISDEAIAMRHERALAEERKKFQTFLKFPWSTRSRANRRIDSRAESSGANTPDPSSPAPQTPSIGGDQDSIPSPLAPSTPLNAMDGISSMDVGESSTSNSIPAPISAAGVILNNVNKRNNGRRRTTSLQKDREMERRSITPDSKELIPPFEPLEFPLSDETFEKLLQDMPNNYQNSLKNEDCPFTIARIRNNIKTDSSTKRNIKSLGNCGTKRQKNNSGSYKAVSFDDDIDIRFFENGKLETHDEEPQTEEEGGETYENDKIDDYGKSFLEPDDTAYDDENYSMFMHRSGSETESSEVEPFPDDDPNDPEWKGESKERIERLRKKM